MVVPICSQRGVVAKRGVVGQAGLKDFFNKIWKKNKLWKEMMKYAPRLFKDLKRQNLMVLTDCFCSDKCSQSAAEGAHCVCIKNKEVCALLYLFVFGLGHVVIVFIGFNFSGQEILLHKEDLDC